MKKADYDALSAGDKFSSRNNDLNDDQKNDLYIVKEGVTILYNLLDSLRKKVGPGDKGRYLSKAISHLENASYDAVRAITIPE